MFVHSPKLSTRSNRDKLRLSCTLLVSLQVHKLNQMMLCRLCCKHIDCQAKQFEEAHLSLLEIKNVSYSFRFHLS